MSIDQLYTQVYFYSHEAIFVVRKKKVRCSQAPPPTIMIIIIMSFIKDTMIHITDYRTNKYKKYIKSTSHNYIKAETPKIPHF